MEIKTFLSLNCPECNEGQFRDQTSNEFCQYFLDAFFQKTIINDKTKNFCEKSRDLSNYEIFQHKILKSQSFKKRAVYW
jgi:hypothetical protein